MVDLEGSDFETELERLKIDYPDISAYLLNDQLDALIEEEFRILWFNALVIIKSFEKAEQIPEKLDKKSLEEHESSNWSLLQNSKPVGFNEKLDAFFKDSEQEDLLALIEDSLAEDDEMQITSAAKEIIFICLKSLVDLFDEADD